MSHQDKATQADETVPAELVYASISSNRNENNISFKHGLLLYSRCNSPIIYDVRLKLVTSILVGHSKEVNGQCFIEQPESADPASVFVISTAHDCKAIIWQIARQFSGDPDQFSLLHEIISPTSSVFTTRCSFIDNEGYFTSVLTTLDGNIYIYFDDQLVQTIATKHCYFNAKFHKVEFKESDHTTKYSLVALAGSDNQLHIYNLNGDRKLEHILDLSGFNDWIKCVEFLTLPNRCNEFLLATACQDSLIQVWLLKLTRQEICEANKIRTKVGTIAGSGVKLCATLETVLSGHDGFVHSLYWFKGKSLNSSKLLQLVSCSSDKTVLIWQASLSTQVSSLPSESKKYQQCPASEGVWTESRRFGETGEANLPFLGLCLSDDEQTLYAQSLRGAIHSWSRDPAARDEENFSWQPSETISGHFDAITDLAWEKTGRYLLSSSLDKTCRLHTVARDMRWHELARPQVHGYEVNCLAPLDFYRFASGSEEKTIRTFEATKFFVKNYIALSQASSDGSELSADSNVHDQLPAHAQLPALGLSNRGSQYPYDVVEEQNTIGLGSELQSGDSASRKPALADNNSWQQVGEVVNYLARVDHLEFLPYEEILLQSTLWWENNKLFGHSNELHALASTSDGSFLASASRANRPDLASVIVWEMEKFRKVSVIEHHSLTVTRLRFSPNDKYLLSVSRDRTWCLCERNPSGQLRNAYRKLAGTVKSDAVHERIIWDCCWTHDSEFFLTVSRDKSAVLWSARALQSHDSTSSHTSESSGLQKSQDKAMNLNYVSRKQFSASIQAVDSARAQQASVNNEMRSYLFVLGFEDGSIELHLVGVDREGKQAADGWQLLTSIPNLHQLAVRRLAFQPMQRHDESDETNDGAGGGIQVPLLASGGDDCMVRLTRFHMRA